MSKVKPFSREDTESRYKAPSHWQPIETAPRDGTMILAYVSDDPGENPYMVRCVGLAVDRFGTGWRGQEMGCYFATHWMPLPSPPEAN